MRVGETPEKAAQRELAEEVGIAASALQPVGAVCGLWEGRRDRVHLFELQLDRMPTLRLDNREIVAARFTPVEQTHTLAVTGPVAAYLGRIHFASSAP